MVRIIPTYQTNIPVHPKTPNHDNMRLVVERHEFRSPSEAVDTRIAILWSYGSGFHKEFLHPLMQRLIKRLRSKPEYNNIHIDFITFDNRTHGDSALLNQSWINEYKPSWFDFAMDVLQVVNQMKLKQSYDKLIGVSHSSGACIMLISQFLEPKTFDGICLMEPVIRTSCTVGPSDTQNSPLVSRILRRQDTFSNREICKKTLLKSSVWSKLHPEVLENYVNYGFYDTDDGTIKLKCPKEQESLLSACGSYDAYTSCISLKLISVPVHIVFCSAPMIKVTARSNPGDIAALSSVITVRTIDGWHNLPGEKPDLLVPEIEVLVDTVRLNQNRSIVYKESRL
ncbi:Alpha/beta hydrolase family-domain-containing protein [Phascolomyces articulosus]|uniref:Alpha/beta hydrolase family-domain-containing protein n=1 Tax=Phascolomyces articulosus TaxID=60185 RepID=A0AAD5K4Y8_9FUNG|nr:Alpha/beta hydrolase family-domain-containing protein [Phascolomyces articulosus]